MSHLTAALAAAADPTRRRILARLARGPASVHELARPFRMSQQGFSKHVAVLERARLIRKRRQGRLRICTLAPAPLAEIAGWAEEFQKLWEKNYARLDALLDEMQAPKESRTATRPNREGEDR